jgi:hypothetical protein
MAVATASPSATPPRATRAARDSPTSSSIARKSSPCSSPISYNWQIAGWLMLAAMRASRRRRSRAAGSATAGLIILIATGRPSRSSYAE